MISVRCTDKLEAKNRVYGLKFGIQADCSIAKQFKVSKIMFNMSQISVEQQVKKKNNKTPKN